MRRSGPRGRPPQDVRSDRGTTRAPQRARARAVRALGPVDHRRGRAARARDRRVLRRAQHVAVRGSDDRGPRRHAAAAAQVRLALARRGGAEPAARRRGRARPAALGAQRPADVLATTGRSRTRSASSSGAERPVLVLRQGGDAYLVAAGGRVLRPLAHPHLSQPAAPVRDEGREDRRRLDAVGAVAAGAAAAAAVARGAALPGGVHFVDVGPRRPDAAARRRVRAAARRRLRPAA